MNLILIFLCIIQFNLWNVSNGMKRERKTYSKRLETFSLHIYLGYSWRKCLEICKSIRNCKSVNFSRFRSGFCQLNSEDHTQNSDALKEGIGYLYSAKSEWDYTEPLECSSCSDSDVCDTSAVDNTQCKIVGCPVPAQVPGEIILGNLFYVGAKRLYTCIDGSEQEIRTCQPDGSWSALSFTCLTTMPTNTASCESPEIENASVNVAHIADGTTVAAVTCNPVFFHRGVNEVQCNTDTLEWDNLDEVGCIEITVDSWTKVYRTISTAKSNVIHSWKQDGKQDTGEFRNDKILSNWEGSSFDSVKVEMIDSEDDSIKYLLFDRTDTDNLDWFSQENLLNSSWTDLTTGSNDVGFFRITGVSFASTGFLRWAILNAEDDKERVNCTTDLVWFAIAKSENFPCTPDRELPRRVMVYSKSSTGTTWEGVQLGFAKEVIVSVHLN